MSSTGLGQKIRDLAKDKKALILAHNYQPKEIQDIADVCGDSLELAKIAKDNSAEVIVFCGVYFMAEAAAILSPQKKVILPDLSAGCPLADSIQVEDLFSLKKRYPRAKVVTYINSTATLKAVSDVICTSSNAIQIVNKLEGDEIIFLPDKNLASFVQRFTNKKIIPWKGFCPTHENFTLDKALEVKRKYPEAVLIVHPECRFEVVDQATEALSTGQMTNFVKGLKTKEVIVGTESDMINQLQIVAPHLNYLPAANNFICPDMKKISLEKLYQALKNLSPIVTVDFEIAKRAKRALDQMLLLSKKK